MGKLYNRILNKIKLNATNNLMIPKEIVYGECIITIRGNDEIYIENYKGILECTDAYIRICAKGFRLLIEGTYLSVSYYNDDEMKIIGNIKHLSFME